MRFASNYGFGEEVGFGVGVNFGDGEGVAEGFGVSAANSDRMVFGKTRSLSAV